MDEITAAYNRITGQDGDWNPDVTLDALKDLARVVAANAWDEGALWRHHASGVHSAGLLWWQDGYPNEPIDAPNPYRITEENN